jgi:hypothetical protein
MLKLRNVSSMLYHQKSMKTNLNGPKYQNIDLTLIGDIDLKVYSQIFGIQRLISRQKVLRALRVYVVHIPFLFDTYVGKTFYLDMQKLGLEQHL